MNLWHIATKDVTLEGYKIPSGVAIVPQMSVVLIDDKVSFFDHFSRLIRSF
jgi:hypothetical protein